MAGTTGVTGDNWDKRGRRSAVLSLGRYNLTTISFSVVAKKNEENGTLLSNPEFW